MKQSTVQRMQSEPGGIKRHLEGRNTEIKRLRGICSKQAKEILRLRAALAPFACLGRGELRPSDFNRAHRLINEKADEKSE